MTSAPPGNWCECDLGSISLILDNLRVPLSAAQRSGRSGPYPYCGANGVLDHIDDFMIDDDVILLAEDGGNFDQYASRPIAYRMQGRIWVNNHAHVLKARNGETEFLFYTLEHKDITPYISSGTRSKLTRGELVRIKVATPKSICEQRKIGATLRDADNLISALERLISKKQAIKQGMMQELLTGRTRLPGFAGKWHRRPLAELLSYEQPTRYLVKTVKQLDSGRIPVLTAGKTFVLGYTNDSDGVYTSHPVIIFDDFTTASQYVDFDFKVKSSAMKILTACPGVDLRFVYERIQLIEFPLGDHKRYWISEYGKQEIEVPTKAEQTAISQIIADSDRELTLLDLRLAKARAIKQGMMQELLTGRTRLVVEGAA